MYDAQGNQIGVFREFDLTIPMKKEDVPQVLKNAVVAAEDRRFWVHEGVDPEGLVRAALTNYREGTVVQGGSTITQQYVKARYLTTERTLSRKLNEAVLATRVERELADELGSVHAAKEEILFRYLDETYFGSGAYGAGAAAQTYFHKDVKDLTISEAATIAGVIPSPSKFGPRDNILLAEAGRERVLRSMFDEGMISQHEFDQAWAQPLWYVGFGFPQEGQQVTRRLAAARIGGEPVSLLRRLRTEVPDRSIHRRVRPGRSGSRSLYRGGLRIDTTHRPAPAGAGRGLRSTTS